MTQEPAPTSSSLITPKQIFVAYAEMKGTRNSFPKTKEYYEKRWRLISSLFEIRIQFDRIELLRESELLNGLTSEWLRSAHYYPLSTPHIGRHPEPDFSIAAAHKGSLARKAAAIRSEYEEMGGELMEALFPEIKEKRVSTTRLHELGLPLKAPNATEECLQSLEESFGNEEDDAATESPRDNVSREQMDELKLAEEIRARADAVLAIDVAAVRKLAVAQGLGTEESIDQRIYEMTVSEFLKLASGYPKVSRVHFNPALISSAS